MLAELQGNAETATPSSSGPRDSTLPRESMKDDALKARLRDSKTAAGRTGSYKAKATPDLAASLGMAQTHEQGSPAQITVPQSKINSRIDQVKFSRIRGSNMKTKFSVPSPEVVLAEGDVAKPQPKTITFTCASCNENIESGGSMFEGKAYHTHHFVCHVETCKKSLAGVLLFEREGNLYCERDYHKNFSPQCAYCTEPIKQVTLVTDPKNAIEAVGKYFHTDHFFCSQCGNLFGADDSFMQYDGKAYCREDYESLFAGKCSACHKPLNDQYITALDRTWHHNCFKCTVIYYWLTF